MSDFLKCECSHCGQPVEFPSEGAGQTIPCPTCEKPITLTSVSSTASVTQNLKKQKRSTTTFSKLTEETIIATTQTGDTPLHRAAKAGIISEIPRHLLTIELFMARNNSFARETALHLAAKYGHLDKVPKEFLTKETLTASTEYEKKESKTGSTPPRTETPLHTAARYGHANQIPKEFLTPEFLSIEASGYRLTVLHQLAYSKRLDLIPEVYANSEMWNLRNSSGQTPREVLESVIKNEAYVANVRSELATEKQKEKLRYFGYAFDEKISKGEASDALDKCARQFPEKNIAYYNRPATKEQLAKLPSRAKASTYGQAKDLIWNIEIEKRIQSRVNESEKMDELFTILGFLRWREDRYRHLTYSRVKKAAKELDKINPGWSKLGNWQDLLLVKVTELYPEFAAKENWQ